MRTLKNILNIFYSINYQDFPAFFEDNLKTWINILKISAEVNIQYTDDKNILIEFLKLKKITMKCINLYCSNYYEDIQEYHNEFLEGVWNLIGLIMPEESFGGLIKELCDYYKILFQYKRYNKWSDDSLGYIINQLVVQNLKLTRKELDEFEENPIDFLRIELEEADMDSSKYFITI